jgi:hypothetical protein
MRPHFPAVVLCVLSVCLPASAQNGLDLFHKMQEALGGTSKIESIADFEECVHANAWDDEGKFHGEVFKRARFARPNHLRLDQTGPGDTYVIYFDGRSGWEILPDKGLTDLVGAELRFAKGYVEGLNFRAWLADRDPETVFTSSGPNTIDISTKNDPSHKDEIKLGPDFLPLTQTSISFADTIHPVTGQSLQFDQWESSGGVKFPRHRINFHSGQKVAEIWTDKVVINAGMKSAELAVKPTDSKPVMCN